MIIYEVLNAVLEIYDNGVVHPKNDDEDLKPRKGVTYCNYAVQRIASKLLYTRFNGKLANQIIDLIESAPEWVSVPLHKAQTKANDGLFVIAGSKGEENGHITVVMPGNEVLSGKWGGSCPLCMNIGRTVFLSKGTNWAFNGIPKFWVLIK